MSDMLRGGGRVPYLTHVLAAVLREGRLVPQDVSAGMVPFTERDRFARTQSMHRVCVWLIRTFCSSLQRMALSAGMHYLKCPLCNDKENFYEAVVDQGYYVPDRLVQLYYNTY